MVIGHINDNGFQITDDEIKRLANMSLEPDINGEIYEIVNLGQYQLMFKFKDGNTYVLITANSINEYKELVKNFFRKFIEYGGQIRLNNNFMDDQNFNRQ